MPCGDIHKNKCSWLQLKKLNEEKAAVCNTVGMNIYVYMLRKAALFNMC